MMHLRDCKTEATRFLDTSARPTQENGFFNWGTIGIT